MAKLKIGGLFRAGTAIGALYRALEDEKEHKVADLQKLVHGIDFDARLRAISRRIKQTGSGQLMLDKAAGLARMDLTAHGRALRDEYRLATEPIVKVEPMTKAAPPDH
ncbi:MAG TPA: hypothetical protein VE996_00710 [Terriglobales bacterium]|jgi:replicative DNA helicase|nr:hypothetical protein [Terriglobales bacterium]